ncbi:unnamed protein product, partial [Iphiclides podalirius]
MSPHRKWRGPSDIAASLRRRDFALIYEIKMKTSPDEWRPRLTTLCHPRLGPAGQPPDSNLNERCLARGTVQSLVSWRDSGGWGEGEDGGGGGRGSTVQPVAMATALA